MRNIPALLQFSIGTSVLLKFLFTFGNVYDWFQQKLSIVRWPKPTESATPVDPGARSTKSFSWITGNRWTGNRLSNQRVLGYVLSRPKTRKGSLVFFMLLNFVLPGDGYINVCIKRMAGDDGESRGIEKRGFPLESRAWTGCMLYLVFIWKS